MQKILFNRKWNIQKEMLKTVSFVGGSCFITKLSEKTKQINGWRQQMVLINLITKKKSIFYRGLVNRTAPAFRGIGYPLWLDFCFYVTVAMFSTVYTLMVTVVHNCTSLSIVPIRLSDAHKPRPTNQGTCTYIRVTYLFWRQSNCNMIFSQIMYKHVLLSLLNM